MSDLLYRGVLRANRDFKALTRRPFSRWLSPFSNPNDRPLIIHSCYHKVGTVWFGRILRDVAAEFGLSFQSGYSYDAIQRYENEKDSDVFLDLGSHVDLSLLHPYRGSHMIRDPRDLVVSAYFYHKWTHETWANLPLAEYKGMTYKRYLNSISKKDGLSLEIRRSEFWIRHMADWDFTNPRTLEIRYEDIMSDEESIFRRLFAHYTFSPHAVDRSCAIARRYGFKALRARGGSGEKSHLRSGRAGEWREHFEDDHVALFKRMYPGVLVRLGYEKADDW